LLLLELMLTVIWQHHSLTLYAWCLLQTSWCNDAVTLSPFPQIDIIGAMMIVWRVRGKIVRSVLCSIVCDNCAQCNADTYEQT